MPDHDQRERERREARLWYQMAGIGFEFVVALLLFGLGGWYLDRLLNTAPWLMLAGGGLGFAVGLSLMVRTARKTFRD